jgi:PAS domain S-box-containing protein
MRDESEQAVSGQITGSIGSLLSAIVDSSSDAIVSKTLEGIIISWNRAAEEMFGYSAAEAVGKSIKLIIPPERIAEEDYVLDKIRKGEKIEHFETIRMTKDGRRLNISLTVSPIRDSEGAIVGASKIARDFTVRKLLEREREELLARERAARQQLAEAVRARDVFIAVAAHELRNPLNVFLLNLQLLHRLSGNPAGSAQVGILIEKTRQQLGRIITLVDRLLDVTRVRSGTFELYRESFELGGLLVEIAARFKGPHPDVSFSMEIEPNINGEWDRTRVDQAVSNLLSNAIKYGMQKPITISAAVAGDQVTIGVRDQGVGIPAADLDRIFDRFERVAGTIGDGLGLGLWITKQIVEAHGGTILARSELGKGSTFVIRLPMHP